MLQYIQRPDCCLLESAAELQLVDVEVIMLLNYSTFNLSRFSTNLELSKIPLLICKASKQIGVNLFVMYLIFVFAGPVSKSLPFKHMHELIAAIAYDLLI